MSSQADMANGKTRKEPKEGSDNRKVALRLGLIAAVMLVLAFLAVPFYSWFCETTGFGGTTQVAVGSELEANGIVPTNETMVVRMKGDTARDMPWEFGPVEPHVDVKIGETNLVYYEAYNPTDQVVTGTAGYNVAPQVLGGYFSKIECFCFTEQTLQPYERVQMPVTFYIDPEILEDSDTREIEELTLSYTFHLTEATQSN